MNIKQITLALSTAIIASSAIADVKFWMVNPSSEQAGKALKEIAADFNAKNAGANVNVEFRSIDQHKASLRIAATSGQSPDIYFSWAGLGLGGEYIKAGLSAPMDSYYKEFKWKDRFLPAATAFSDLYPGAKHGVPYTFRGESLYYNKTLFAKAGITAVPQTYAELLTAADKLKKIGVAPITFGGSVNWHLMRLMDVIIETKCGAEKHDELKALKLKWDTETCVASAFTEFHNWTANYVLKPFMGFDENQAYNLFAANKAAMMLEGDWLVGRIETSKKLDETGVFPFPTGTKRLYGFAEYLYVSSKSPNKDMAAKFLDYLNSDAVQQKYLGVLGSVSVNRNVKYTKSNSLDAEWLKIFNDYSQTFVNGDQALPLQITTEYFRIINEVASDHIAPANAGAELQKFINKQ